MITPGLLARMYGARDRLQSYLEAPLRVSEVAREAGLTTAHFITQFRALFGQTPLQCRTRARLEQACAALHARGESATQIGLALGFDNPGSFSRAFARHVGMPPRIRRRSAGHAVAPAGCDVRFTMDPTTHGPVRLAIFADTCGNLIQIYQHVG